jgi:hypothetical protein
MTPFEKIDLAVDDLRARGVRKATAAPLFYCLLWRLGIATAPPLYQGFLGTFVLQGCMFGVPLGAVLACADRRLAPDGAILLGTAGGIIYGALMALYFRVNAYRLGLPKWDDYLPDTGTEEEEGW